MNNKNADILVVDDEPNIRLLVRTVLETEQYRIFEAANGREAIEIIASQPIDLVILDLSMPVLDGMAVLERMRQDPSPEKPPVIVLTAYGSVGAAVRAMKLGAREFLEKPVTPDELRTVVQSVLEESPPGAAETDHEPETYDDVLGEVRQALRAGEFGNAESLLMKAGTVTDDDASFLNLVGVLYEARGRSDSARRYYGRAIRAKPGYAAAQQNMRRLYELDRFGHTDQDVLLGDELSVRRASHDHHAGESLLVRLRKLFGGRTA